MGVAGRRPQQYSFEDGDLARSSTLANVNFAIEKVVQDCRFILRAIRPPPRIPALARFELERPRGSAIADLVGGTLWYFSTMRG